MSGCPTSFTGKCDAPVSKKKGEGQGRPAHRVVMARQSFSLTGALALFTVSFATACSSDEIGARGTGSGGASGSGGTGIIGAGPDGSIIGAGGSAGSGGACDGSKP